MVAGDAFDPGPIAQGLGVDRPDQGDAELLVDVDDGAARRCDVVPQRGRTFGEGDDVLPRLVSRLPVRPRREACGCGDRSEDERADDERVILGHPEAPTPLPSETSRSL